jgi:hypothetical protein
MPGKIVTNARGGDSLHNYVGADFILDGLPGKPGIQWSWEIRMQMGEIAESCGLE